MAPRRSLRYSRIGPDARDLKVGHAGPPPGAGSTVTVEVREDGLFHRRAASGLQATLREAQDSSSIGNGVGSQYFSNFKFLTDCAS